MALIMLLIITGLVLWFLWYLFVKAIVWTFQPISDYVDKKEIRRIKFENAVLEKLNKIGEKGEPDSLIALKSRCPRCHQRTMYYNPSTDRSTCKECDS